MTQRIFVLCIACVAFFSGAFAQNSVGGGSYDVVGRQGRYILTAVPFMTFAPDARGSAMGDIGAASTPDANSMYWNPSKLAFIDKKMGVSLNYTPWLRKLVNDMSLAYLSGYTKLRKEETIGVSLRYFDMGSITFTDNDGYEILQHRPNEFALNAAYARKLSDNFSLSVGIKYIYSNLTGGVSNSGGSTKPGNTVAADVSAYYTKKGLRVQGTPVDFAMGLAISNLGGKISYRESGEGNFIPTNMRLGVSAYAEINEYNKIGLLLDVNKLLVPTPPVYKTDEDGNIVKDENGTPEIAEGKDPNRGWMSGVFGSFSDAPDGFAEEMEEFMISAGVEYLYSERLAVRGGYFFEHQNKGGRKYFMVGAGLTYQMLTIDLSYLIPQLQNHPLQDTLRISLLVNFGEKNDNIDSVEDN